MSEFEKHRLIDGTPVEINLEQVLYVRQARIGHAVHLPGCSLSVADWDQHPVPEPAHPVQTLFGAADECPNGCEHDMTLHAGTYDGRLKCRVCNDDEDREDCLVETELYRHNVRAIQEKWASDQLSLDSEDHV